MFVRLHLNRSVLNDPTKCQLAMALVASGVSIRGEDGDICLQVHDTVMNADLAALGYERASIVENLELTLVAGRHYSAAGATGTVETFSRRGQWEQRVTVYGRTINDTMELYSSIRSGRTPDEPWVSPTSFLRRAS